MEDLFKELDSNPVLTRFSILQSYICKLRNNGKITEAEFKAIRPKNACSLKAYWVTKNLIIYHCLDPSEISDSAHYLAAIF